MDKPAISAIAPFFVVRNVAASLAFYRDSLGFEIMYQGPSDDDIFFGMVHRGAAMIMMKDIGVDPIPNYTRDIKKGFAPWDAYVYVPDPDGLAQEFAQRKLKFWKSLQDTHDGLRGFEIQDVNGYVLFFGKPIEKETENAQ
ncbi:MAG TPA: VOC family protein [Chryseosolibacter sp.]